MKRKTAVFFLAGVLTANASSEIPFSAEWILRGDLVINDVVLLSTNDVKIRDTCLTNVFHSIQTNGFIITKLSNRTKEGEFEIQGAEFIAENNICFEVGYYATTNKLTGGLAALARSTFLASSTVPPWFYQYMDGPGNVCLLFLMSDATKPQTIRHAFFCRDNVAVTVKNLYGGDIFAFIKLLDACILASSTEEPK